MFCAEAQLDKTLIKIPNAKLFISLSGAITMALHGVGLGVFPKHCVATQLRKKELFAFQSGQDKPTDHPIYIIHLADKYPTARVRRVLDVFWALKN
jgi:DNA-binding transcriptional LysR family regulator